ncbi:MAG TPA: HAD family phosphatase [Candidatus Binatia bacterium]|nr:HAD family phosphatase [Candidatus Binatia bacterium]
MPGPRALIFDFDGVITDSEPLHLAAFQRALGAEGIALDRDTYYAEYLGFNDHDAVAHALARAGRPARADAVRALVERKAAHFIALVGRGAPLFPGVAALVRTAAAHVPLAIASGALRHEIELVLRGAGLADAFAAIVSAEDVREGKPSPEPFLAVLAALRRRVGDLEAGECLVVEDSEPGVAAARAAGMRCLAVTNSVSRQALADADRVVASLEEVRWDELARLFA